MAERIRVGFVGAGGIAAAQARALLKLDDVELVAACDIKEDAARAFADKFEAPHTFTDYHEMLALDGLDAVTVCTPNSAHKGPTIAALQAGKHVMVEKPMAMNAEEAQAMVDAAEASDGDLVMGFQWRLGPQVQTVKRFVDAGELGNVLYARVQALRRRGIPHWGVFGRKELQGGGPLIDIGVHLIEAAHFLMGEPKPTSASAQTFTYMGNKPPTAVGPWEAWDWETYNVEDLAVGFVRFDGGAVMVVESSFAAHIEGDKFGIQIMGDKGGITALPPMLFKDEAGTQVNVQPGYVGKWDSISRKMAEWIGYIRGENETQCPAESGLVVQKILDGLYRSADEGREVQIA
ncbi:MAG: Gfo/Idh/MocA family oxidoreductase [Planctomycetes bacterium]|nr:Gfo/Idh/MocA family oxidoreductase [Planctomycetota bacterium]